MRARKQKRPGISSRASPVYADRRASCGSESRARSLSLGAPIEPLLGKDRGKVVDVQAVAHACGVLGRDRDDFAVAVIVARDRVAKLSDAFDLPSETREPHDLVAVLRFSSVSVVHKFSFAFRLLVILNQRSWIREASGQTHGPGALERSAASRPTGRPQRRRRPPRSPRPPLARQERLWPRLQQRGPRIARPSSREPASGLPPQGCGGPPPASRSSSSRT